MNSPLPAPDDTAVNQSILEASNLTEALWEIAEKYGIPLTNNQPRWVNGQYLREAGDFIEDVHSAMKRFPLKDTASTGAASV